jgi:hypothetical protein
LTQSRTSKFWRPMSSFTLHPYGRAWLECWRCCRYFSAWYLKLNSPLLYNHTLLSALEEHFIRNVRFKCDENDNDVVECSPRTIAELMTNAKRTRRRIEDDLNMKNWIILICLWPDGRIINLLIIRPSSHKTSWNVSIFHI